MYVLMSVMMSFLPLKIRTASNSAIYILYCNCLHWNKYIREKSDPNPNLENKKPFQDKDKEEPNTDQTLEKAWILI